jgi:leucyl-tRNA synthetase
MMTITKLARHLARELRKNTTRAESALWDKLRNIKFMGLKFLRQHPIFYKYNNKKKFFIADFYCNEKKTVIEVDGEIHRNQKDYDEARTEMLESKRLTVIRFKNEEILSNINAVIIKLKRKIECIEQLT